MKIYELQKILNILKPNIKYQDYDISMNSEYLDDKKTQFDILDNEKVIIFYTNNK